MMLPHKIAFLGVVSALRMVPFPLIPLHSFLSTMVKVDEIDVILRNENIGAPDVTCCVMMTKRCIPMHKNGSQQPHGHMYQEARPRRPQTIYQEDLASTPSAPMQRHAPQVGGYMG